MGKIFHVTSMVVDYDPSIPLESWPRPRRGFRIVTINRFDLKRCKMARRMFRAYLHDLYKKQITVDFRTWIKENTQQLASVISRTLPLLYFERTQSDWIVPSNKLTVRCGIYGSLEARSQSIHCSFTSFGCIELSEFRAPICGVK